ncbi:MAG: hypothetical protein EKK29_08950 [Hyphomicrobiales bacterium]|nr:MAG: hypothetical protein EKK29_08950 [Hyphomicrobiales bacterium]
MTDATTHGHSHAHDSASGESLGAAEHDRLRQAASRALPARASLLEASSGARLMGASVAAALLWAGVYWALH